MEMKCRSLACSRSAPGSVSPLRDVCILDRCRRVSSNMRPRTALEKKSPKKRSSPPAPEKETARPLKNPSPQTDNVTPETALQNAHWLQDIIILRKAAEELARRRVQRPLPRTVDDGSFREIAEMLDDDSAVTRQWAVRKLYELNGDLAATLVNDALRDGSPEKRRNIGNALAESGLLFQAIDDLMDENHERCYGAFSLLLLVAKAGVVQPLISVIEKHPSIDLRLAVIRLLATSREMQVVSALEGLASRDLLAPELRSATSKAISQITSHHD